MSDSQKKLLCMNIAEDMKTVPGDIIEKMLGHFEKCDPSYAEGIRKHLNQSR